MRGCGRVVTYNVVWDVAENAQACGLSEAAWMDRWGGGVDWVLSDLMQWSIDETAGERGGLQAVDLTLSR